MTMPLLFDLSPGATALANVGAWLLVHAGTGYLVHRLPAHRLRRDGPLLRLRPWERSGTAYERVLRVRRWKDHLPEAGDLFAGGVSKRHLPSPGAAGVERFVVETRRAERGHWLAMAGGPLAVLWNPPAGVAAMVAYGVLVNLPFVVVQRYNRARALRVLARSSGSPAELERRSRTGPRTTGNSIP